MIIPPTFLTKDQMSELRRRRNAQKSNDTISESLNSMDKKDDSKSIHSDDHDAPFVSLKLAFVLLLCARLTSAFYNIITDCDETYNYWEPLHYLMYGFGMQTWEWR